MKEKAIRKFKQMDWILIATIFALCSIGVLMVYSASLYLSYETTGDFHAFFKRQLIWLGLGCLVFWLASVFSYKAYGKWIKFIMLITVLLLIVVLIPGIGVERNFSRRWIGIGSFVVQPSEIAKLTMIIYFAHAYTKKQRVIENFKQGVIPPLIALGFVFLLILMQPDLGTASLILAACGTIVFCSGARWRHIFLLMGTALFMVLILAVSEPYRLKRITSFLDPYADPDGAGYQLINSFIAISSGGWTGQGLGLSSQKFGYLPEAHTDFIMAVIAEEFGLIGIYVVLGLYITFMIRGFLISRQVDDIFAKLLAIGITFKICIQMFLNLGAMSGLLPITGITLPFISYGGSSLVITLAMAGILVQLSTHRRQKLHVIEKQPIGEHVSI
ncbi:putative lipid II flippase FtsW [Metabacillus iocasae]|uniref:Probable peptidoglycan glycosyltransferase FtsW n=1 Tax=Priestia iocasae TaxID=2291674 RepID=A0ABS2QRN8_9BACI|nr:putative lipid II flippase FtsW [Metabacillus iocasae]MBM7702135.1 cell division protein FtsW [Metabacillus iocasae]